MIHKNPAIHDPAVYWKRFERDQARRERFRLVRNGTILPFQYLQPQLLIHNEAGDWIPEIIRYA